MGRTGGQETKEKILKTAELLFAEKGVDGTSMDEVALKSGVNKALIYYYFKNKKDLKVSLYKKMSSKLHDFMSRSIDQMHSENKHKADDILKELIDFLAQKKKILAMMLMESIKDQASNNQLFEIAKVLITNENSEIKKKIDYYEKGRFDSTKQYLVHEFFTGFIPIVIFVIFQDRFADFFKYQEQELLENFIDAFKKSHLAHHF